VIVVVEDIQNGDTGNDEEEETLYSIMRTEKVDDTVSVRGKYDTSSHRYCGCRGGYIHNNVDAREGEGDPPPNAATSAEETNMAVASKCDRGNKYRVCCRGGYPL
jgi:hypothetical protein